MNTPRAAPGHGRGAIPRPTWAERNQTEYDDMELKDQQELVRGLCASVAEALIRESHNWPEHWNGHELRELVADAFAHERTTAMNEDRGRRRRFNRENASRFQSTLDRTKTEATT